MQVLHVQIERVAFGSSQTQQEDTPMRTSFVNSLLVATLAVAVGAQTQTSEGRDLAKLAFQSVDRT
tara:strand:+ start:125 stop:322 length:198 start_codon:yes stop_codon:yes gene_type:complete